MREARSREALSRSPRESIMRNAVSVHNWVFCHTASTRRVTPHHTSMPMILLLSMATRKNRLQDVFLCCNNLKTPTRTRTHQTISQDDDNTRTHTLRAPIPTISGTNCIGLGRVVGLTVVARSNCICHTSNLSIRTDHHVHRGWGCRRYVVV